MRKATFEELVTLLDYPQLTTHALHVLGDLGDRRAVPYIFKHAKANTEKVPYLEALVSYNCEEYLMDLLSMGIEGTAATRKAVEMVVAGLKGIDLQQQKIALTSIKLKNQLVLGEVYIDLSLLDFLNRCHLIIENIPTRKAATILKIK